MFLRILLAFAEVEQVKDKEYTPITFEQGVIWFAIILCAILVAIYVAGFFRGNALGKIDETSNHLDEFRKLRDEGMLDDEEFSQVKTSIAFKNTEQEVEFNEDTSNDAENNSQP